MKPLAPAFAMAALLLGAGAEYAAVQRKFAQISQEQLRPGSRVSLTQKELNAYVAEEVRKAVPQGVRKPHVELGEGKATGSALIDFAKVKRAQGNPPGWLMDKLLSGERDVQVTARIDSRGGKARVDVQRVEVSGIPIEGQLLDWLIDHYVRSRYPNAKVGEPFELGHRMERLEVKPGAVNVHIAK